MSMNENIKLIDNLGFIPSFEEQMLLPSLLVHNILIVYRENSNLLRMMSLVSLFMLKRKENQKQKILVILKRFNQNQILNGLKTSRLIDYRITVVNGSILPNARKKDYQNYSIILTTPKTLKNDLKENNITNQDEFQLVFILSAENSVGSRAIRYITKKLSKSRFIGCTRITNHERLIQICQALGLSEVLSLQSGNVESRTNIYPYFISYPKEYFFVLNLLDQLRKFEIEQLRYSGLNLNPKITITQVKAIHEGLKREGNTKVMIQTANICRIYLLQRMVISQGFEGAINYFTALESRLTSKKIKEQSGQKAISIFLNDIKVQKLREYILFNRKIPHPKIHVLFNLLSQYSEGVLILTHNYYNSLFLQKCLEGNGLRVLYVERPISSFNEIELKRSLLPFTERKISICIANAVNQYLASYSSIIIAYDISTNTVDALNALNTEIPRIFLIGKGTNEQNQFFSLRNIGKSELNLELLNSKLKSQFIEKTHKMELKDLILSPVLYELLIPYILSGHYNVIKSNEIKYPGLITETKDFILIITSETISSMLPDPYEMFNDLKETYEKIEVLFIPKAFENYSIEARYTLFNLIKELNILNFPITSLNEVPLFIDILLKK